MSMVIVAVHSQRVALSTFIILKLYYVGNQGCHDVKLQVTMVAIVQCERGVVNVL